MKKYINKSTLTEAIRNVHFMGEPSGDIVQVTATHEFFTNKNWLNPDEESPFGYSLAWESSKLVRVPIEISAEEIESSRLISLEVQAQAYQDSVMSKNEASALLGRTVSELKPKAKANYDWLQSLWALYYAKKVDASNDTEFSSIGDKPNTFAELQLEEQG
jgi:hypothetical protein